MLQLLIASYDVFLCRIRKCIRTYVTRVKKRVKVESVLVATCIQQATCIKQACIHFPKKANALKCTCVKQAPVLRKQRAG